MDTAHSECHHVLQAWAYLTGLAESPSGDPLSNWQIAPPTAGQGLSGAEVWRVERGGVAYALRRWPEERPTVEQLRWIHRQLWIARQAGLEFIAEPYLTGSGDSCLRHGNCLWELSRWLPGKADFHASPNTHRLADALRCLAELHGVWSIDPDQCGRGVAPGVRERLSLARTILSPVGQQTIARIDRRWGDEIAAACRHLLVDAPARLNFWLARLAGLAARPLPLQPCLRDVWHDHVLFGDDRVTGIIDYGALRVDCVGGDIARLLASLVGTDDALWRLGMDAYAAVNPLRPEVAELITVYAAINPILSGFHWARWLYEEQRQFDPAAVLARLRALIAQAGPLADPSGHGGALAPG